MTEIKHRITGRVLWADDRPTVRESLEAAVAAGANLARANLAGAYLARANLARANLARAYLERIARLRSVFPQRGSFLAFKKVKAPCGSDAVLLVEIPADAERINAISSRKGRSSHVIVKELVSGPVADFYVSKTDTDESRAVRYVVGETTTAHEFCDDVRVECAPGIHFWLTELEASEW